MKKIHLIMPMGGEGSRFFKNGFLTPKPLITIKDKPFFYWATKSLLEYIEIEDLTFVVLQKHIDEFQIDSEIHKYFPKAKIEIIPHLLNGAVLTCIDGVKNINDDLPIVFNDCDHMFFCSEFNSYCNEGDFSELDGALLTFTSNDSKYSFLEIDDSGNVVNTVEKKAISDKAICGTYYFRNKQLFLESVKEYLEKCNYSEYFISGLYNIMASYKMKIRNFICDEHLSFGTPEEYYAAEKSNNFKRLIK